MKILITTIVDPQKSAHNRLHHFMGHLRGKGHDLTILSINDWWKASQVDVKLSSDGLQFALRNIKCEYFTERRVNPVFQEVLAPLLLRRYPNKVKTNNYEIHLNYGTLISGYYLARKLKCMGVNTVYDICDDNPQMIRVSPQIPAILRPAGGLFGRIMFKKNIQIAKAVTYTVNSLKNAYGVPESKAVHVPNGVDTGLFKPCYPKQSREALGITESDFVIGYVGVLREWIDLEPIFVAVSKLGKHYSNLKILIVGEEGGLSKQRELANKYGISDRVIFTGTVPYTRVPEYISCMNVGLIARKPGPVAEKMLPLKLFEYMACEKPVIATKLTGVSEAVGDMVLYASTAEEYQGTIAKLYEDRELATKMGTRGRQFVEQNYSWESSCTKLEQVLTEVAKT